MSSNPANRVLILVSAALEEYEAQRAHQEAELTRLAAESAAKDLKIAQLNDELGEAKNGWQGWFNEASRRQSALIETRVTVEDQGKELLQTQFRLSECKAALESAREDSGRRQRLHSDAIASLESSRRVLADTNRKLERSLSENLDLRETIKELKSALASFRAKASYWKKKATSCPSNSPQTKQSGRRS